MGARYGNVMCLLIYWLLSANIEWLRAGVCGAPQAGGWGYRNMSLYGIWHKLDNQLSLSNHNMRISYVFHFPAQVQCHIISLPISYIHTYSKHAVHLSAQGTAVDFEKQTHTHTHSNRIYLSSKNAVQSQCMFPTVRCLLLHVWHNVWNVSTPLIRRAKNFDFQFWLAHTLCCCLFVFFYSEISRRKQTYVVY